MAQELDDAGEVVHVALTLIPAIELALVNRRRQAIADDMGVAP
ncbi:hypothetical protein [Gordonia sp. SID5947]|nr:hypothetical protein [Gordonia sp. SID5947]